MSPRLHITSITGPENAKDLPCPLPGHWNATDGHEMAVRYATMTRAELHGGSSTDMMVAFEIAMLCRNDLDFEAVLASARDRIRWLSVQLALARHAEMTEAKIIQAWEEGYLSCAISAPHAAKTKKAAQAVLALLAGCGS